MRVLLFVSCLFAATSLAANYRSGEVFVVEDTTGDAHDPNSTVNSSPLSGGLPTTLCQFAAKGLYTQYPDDYDGVVMFTTNPMTDQQLAILNTMRGNIVRQTAQGISETAFVSLGGNPATTYGSPAKLGQCVWMGAISQLPASPDAQATTLFGGFIPLGMGITGAELMGHEYGHHWLLWAAYDKNDGKGHQYLMRGDEGDHSTNTTPSPNGHWNHYSDARSVMYGSFITPPSSGNTFTLAGGVRKYNEFDQYLMGLRGPSEVSPILIVDDGSGYGAGVQPLWRGATTTVTGTGFTVSVQDVVRALGPRVPDVTASQKCFRTAFVLVQDPHYPVTPALLAKVEAYRARFSTWFDFATDNRGHMDTRLTGGAGCVQPGTDAGVVTPPQDAGTLDLDAGVVETPDAGGEVLPEDAGVVENPPADPQDAGTRPGKWDTQVPLSNGTIRPGCGCTEASLLPTAALALAALGLLRRRRAA